MSENAPIITRRLDNGSTITDCTITEEVSDPSPELIEVMARTVFIHAEECDDWLTVDEVARDHYRSATQAALRAAQAAGYVIEKPFWPPETQETRHVSAAGLSGGK